MFPHRHNNVQYRKPMIRAGKGAIASQSLLAAKAGAEILIAGGNAMDAAVATSFALGAVEPWMSGLGGGGYMMVYSAKEDRVSCIDYGMVAPQSLDPADYPIVAAKSESGFFGWPMVREDRNLKGPYSIAVPGLVAGLKLAHDKFGSAEWSKLFGPARYLAERGLPVDWYGALGILVEARELAEFAETRAVYLKDGLTPAPNSDGSTKFMPICRVENGVNHLSRTLQRLAEKDGAESFYRGDLAQSLVRDLKAAGSKITAADLAAYRARLVEPLVIPYRDATVFAAPGLTAGPTLQEVLADWSKSVTPGAKGPQPGDYAAFGAALDQAYKARLKGMGAQSETPAKPACTSHFCVVDGQGNVVSLTQTLLSRFGSKVLLPETGILMNNGIMWFDPEPGKPNSLAPGKRPLSNMCPVIAQSPKFGRVALGASGGRKIMPAVAQLLSYLIDFGMDLETAFHTPRIDATGEGYILMDDRIATAAEPQLSRVAPVKNVELLPYPALFANPSAAQTLPDGGGLRAMTDVASPWSGAAGVG
jgi:gamma-glutamyltranspeptidase/glutathione hydrolase